MTHSLHRWGSRRNLENDYVVLMMASRDINRRGAAEKLRDALSILLSFEPVNIGDMKSGSMLKETTSDIMQCIKDDSIVHAVFTSKEEVEKLILEMKKADLGLSVVVTGLFDRIFEILGETGLRPHTVNTSLGFWGDASLLPSEDVLKITTMCGHGMIPPRLVHKLIHDVKTGIRTPEDAAMQLAICCTCGIFNPARAALLIRHIVSKNKR